MNRRLSFLFCFFLMAFALAANPTSTSSPDKLEWKHNKNLVNADIRTWDLPTLLSRISAETGWEVLVEPGTKRDVSVKFSDLPIENALLRLLGPLNYALLPQTNAAPKLLVFKTTMGKATESIRQIVKKGAIEGNERNRIRNQLIVRLSPDSALTIEELAEMLGAKIVGRSDALRAYLLEFPDEAAATAAREKLAGSPNVASVENNYKFNPPPPSLNAPGSSLPFNLKPVSTADSKNPIVALLDTRVQGLDPAKAQFLLTGVYLLDGAPQLGELTHGTSMANALLDGMSNGLDGDKSTPWKILPIDIYGANESTTTFHVAQGITEAVLRGATIINMSLGSETDSYFLREVIANASAQNIVFFGAAGNVPTDAPTYPAAYPQVMAVTAGDRDRNLAPYANFGSFVDVIGPGGTIVRHGGTSYFVGGTSVATAYISGLAAGAAVATGKSLADIQSLIRQNLAFTPPATTTTK